MVGMLGIRFRKNLGGMFIEGEKNTKIQNKSTPTLFLEVAYLNTPVNNAVKLGTHQRAW